MKKHYKILIKKKFDEELEKEWLKLEVNSNISFFQTFNWQKYWYENCGLNVSNIIVLLYKDGNLVCILPFNIENKNIFRVLNWNGFPFSDYNSPIIQNYFHLSKYHFDLIINEIKKLYKFDYIYLINLTNISFLRNKIIPTTKSFKLIFSERNKFQDILSKFEKKILYEKKRLMKLSEVLIDLEPDNKTKSEIIDFFIYEKKKQLNRTHAWDYLDKKIYLNYIINLRKLDPKNIHFSCLRLGNKIISSHIGYIYDNKFYYIFPVYNRKYQKYSTGNILLYYLIKNCFINKFESYDYTIGDEFYKKKISNEHEIIYNYIDFINFKGFICSSFLRLRIKLKNYLLKKKYFK